MPLMQELTEFNSVGTARRRTRNGRDIGTAEQRIGDAAGEARSRGTQLFDRGQDAFDDAGTARDDFRTSIDADPFEAAGQAQDFLGESARGFASDLMPDLMRGLRAARSRFGGRGGGAIRSGGAQQGEEFACDRLFSGPLQNKIAQLASTSLAFGQSETQRRTGNLGAVADQDIRRSGLAFDASGAESNRFFSGLGGQAGREHERGLAGDQRNERRGRGIGSLLGTVAGGVIGSVVPGLGTAVGAGLGNRLFN